jgi:hypothetical protein
LIGALIAVLSVGGAAYVYRDDLTRLAGTFSAPAPSAGPAEQAKTSSTTKIPPLTPQQPPPLAPSPASQEGTNLPSPPAPESNPPGQTETARIEPPAAPEPSAQPPRPVTAETLADALPPRVAQTSVDLPAATVGSVYRAELPAFVDPGGKGLRLTASGLPEGLTFSDVGGGKGAIEGVPQQPASASIRIVATNQHDRTAQMTAMLSVGDRLAPHSEPVAKPEKPVPEKPPASPPTQQKAVLAAPSLAVKPETVAREEAPPFERPAPALNDYVPLAAGPRSAEEKARAFVASFDGGECFLVEPLPGATKPHEYQAVGRAVEPARRFDSAYKRDVGVEAALTMAPITTEQCPALDLIRLAAPDARQAPRLTLQHYQVGLGQPLSGTISNLAQRRPYLVLVDNDGLVHRLETKVDASGDSATFSVPLTADANSVGPMQMLLAIVSAKPVPALDALRSANLKSIASRLVEDVRGASAAVGADYFKFVN